MKKLYIDVIVCENGGEMNHLKRDITVDTPESMKENIAGDKNISSVIYTIFASRTDIDYIPKYLAEFCPELHESDVIRETARATSEDITFTIDEYRSIHEMFKNGYNFNNVEIQSVPSQEEDEEKIDSTSESSDMDEESDDEYVELEKIHHLSIRVYFEASKLTMVSDIMEGGQINVVINVTDPVIQWHFIKNEIETKILTASTIYDFDKSIVVDFVYKVIADPSIYHMIQQCLMMAVDMADLRFGLATEDDISIPMFNLHFNHPNITVMPNHSLNMGKVNAPSDSFDDFISSFEKGSGNSSGESSIFSSDFTSSVYQGKKNKKKKKK